jgi:hypothetical protein
LPRKKPEVNQSDWLNKVDAATNNPTQIEQRKNIEPGLTVPRRG